MDTKYKLINNAQRRAEEIQQIAENYTRFAISIKEDPKTLMEGATQVLAGLKSLMGSGQPLTKAGLSPASLAGVVAGLRVLTRALPKMQDEAKKLKALKVLGGLSLGKSMSLGAVTAIANLADKDPQHDDLRAAFDQYAQSNKPNPELLKTLQQLQMEVDQAMRTTQVSGEQGAEQQPQQGQPQQGTPPPAVQSGTISTSGGQGQSR